ncbi:MAG: histidinol-phosphate transaminase [Caldilineaceae bacterium]
MTTMVTHGTTDYAELTKLGLTPADVTYFSSNINPYGPAPAVVDAVRAAVDSATLARYPDRLSLELRAALAQYHHVAPEAIVVGNGSADLMWLVALHFLQRKRVAILVPTFGEYDNIASMAEATVIKLCHPGWQAIAPNRYAPGDRSVQECGHALAAAQPDVVFLCNPNNPTGHYLSPSELNRLHDAAPEAIWVIDEAYAEFTPTPWSAIQWLAEDESNHRWLILRSMTKDYALGGLRLGYAVTSPQVAQALQQIQPPWNVNALAQVAGLAALDAPEWVAQTIGHLREHVELMRSTLYEHGLQPLPTTTNFFLLPVHGLLDGTAVAVRKALLRERLIVRDCTSFGLPDYIRIAAMLPAQNELLLDALVRLTG